MRWLLTFQLPNLADVLKDPIMKISQSLFIIENDNAVKARPKPSVIHNSLDANEAYTHIKHDLFISIVC